MTPTDPATCDPFVVASVQRFSVTNGNTTGSLTRWQVGGGAGLVPYSGVDVHPTYPNHDLLLAARSTT